MFFFMRIELGASKENCVFYRAGCLAYSVFGIRTHSPSQPIPTHSTLSLSNHTSEFPGITFVSGLEPGSIRRSYALGPFASPNWLVMTRQHSFRFLL